MISFIFPVYNEEESLPKLFSEMQNILSQLNSDVEMIFINDGSRDRSLEYLLNLAKNHSSVKVINFSRNFGHQVAITAGLDHATGDAVITMDADLQDPPEVALDLIKKWREGYEMVYAKRRHVNQQETWLKKITAKWFYKTLDYLSDLKIPRNTGDFRLMDRKVVEELNRCREKSRYMRGLAVFVGFKQACVLFDRQDRFAGQSGYKLFKQSLKLAIDGITGFSVKPLKLITYFGFTTALLSFLGIVYALIMKVFFPEVTVSGFTLTIIAIFFLGGVQMLMLGIIGEYIGRIYTEVQDRPLYIIKDKINFSNDKPTLANNQ